MSGVWLYLVAAAAVGGSMPILVKYSVRGVRHAVGSAKWWWDGCRDETAYPCPECGYDIRRTPHRCPECGTKLMWGMLPGRRDRRRR